MNKYSIIKYIIVFMAGALASWLVIFSIGQPPNSNKAFSVREGNKEGFDLINPLLECELGEELIAHELKPFKEKITTYIDEEVRFGNITNASVYFRDLNNGLWTGIDEKEEFAPASLLKVPLMIVYLKLAESDPYLLSQSLEFKPEMVDKEYFQDEIPNSERLQVGNSYTIESLIDKMIVYSSNDAKTVLIMNIDPAVLYNEYKDLGLNVKDVQELSELVTVKQYATFFRVLFNASYLSKEMSQKALELLNRAGFDRGLRAGVPKDVKVAHKFGTPLNPGPRQLHDCGIIYYSKNPYLLCVMSRGNDYDKLEKFIANVSGIVYKSVDDQH